MYTPPKVNDVSCFEFECTETPTHHFEWPWGEQGYTCTPHIAQLRSTATKLGREVSLSSLLTPPPPPPSSDEEVARLNAELSHARSLMMAQSLELHEAKAQNEDLLRELSVKQQQIDAFHGSHPGG